MAQYLQLTEVLSKSTRPVIINMSLVIAMHAVSFGTRLRLSSDSANSIDVSEDIPFILKLLEATK
jgi:hypothetical protein